MSTWRVPRITSYEEGSPLCPIGLSSEQQDKGQQDTPKAVSPDVHPPQGLHPPRLRGSVCGQGTKPSKDTAFPSYPELHLRPQEKDKRAVQQPEADGLETERCGREPGPRGRVRAGFRRSSIGCSRLLLGGSRRLALGYALGSRLHLLGDPSSPGWLALAQRRLVLARALKTGRWARVRITPQSRTMCRWLLCGSEVLERAFGNKGLAHQRHGPWPGFLPVPQASAFHRRQEPALLTVFVSAFLATHARVSSQRLILGRARCATRRATGTPALLLVALCRHLLEPSLTKPRADQATTLQNRGPHSHYSLSEWRLLEFCSVQPGQLCAVVRQQIVSREPGETQTPAIGLYLSSLFC